MAAVTQRAKSVCAQAGLDDLAARHRRAGHVIDLDGIAAGQRDQNAFVVSRAHQVCRHGAGLDAPLDGLALQVQRDQLVTVLHGRVNRAALAVYPQVAGRLAGSNALGQRHVAAVPAKNIDVVEPVGGGDKPFHVGRKAQVVRVEHTAHGALDFSGARVDEGQRVRQRVGHNHRLLVRREVQVVRLLAGGDAAGFFPRCDVNHADGVVQRIEHKQWRRCGDRRGCGSARGGCSGRRNKDKCTGKKAECRNHKKYLVCSMVQCSGRRRNAGEILCAEPAPLPGRQVGRQL